MTDTAIDQPENPTANLFRIEQELSEATADVALLKRLGASEARMQRLTAEREAAIDQRDAALDKERDRLKAAHFASLSDINVSDRRPEEGVLSAVFVIEYTQLTYDMYAKASLPTQHTVAGFVALKRLPFDYLIERHPSRIPAKIMALAPGNPRKAFDIYFQGLNRGHLQAPAV